MSTIDDVAGLDAHGLYTKIAYQLSIKKLFHNQLGINELEKQRNSCFAAYRRLFTLVEESPNSVSPQKQYNHSSIAIHIKVN